MKEKICLDKVLAIPVLVLMCIFAALLLGQGSVFAGEVNEEEPNDDGYTANYIDFGDRCRGETDVNTGCDCFYFSPEHSRNARLYIKDDDPQRIVHVGIYEGNTMMAEIDSGLGTLGEKKISFGVREGKDYYIQIYDDENFDDPDSAAPYSFRLFYEVKNAAVSKLTVKKGAFTIKWKRVKDADFYQVAYTTQVKYKKNKWKGASIKKVSKKNLTATVKKLKRKKAYCAAVRAVKKIDRVYYYSDFCKTKAFKIR